MNRDVRRRMRARPDRFVVGYLGRTNIVFGKDTANGDWKGYTDAGLPMTRHQARRYLSTMPCSNCVVFELVPVEINS